MRLLFTALTALVFPVLSHAAIAGSLEQSIAGVSVESISVGTVIDTLMQRTAGVRFLLAQTVAPPLPAAGSVFRHDKSGIEFTLPAGWSVREVETAPGDPGEMAVLAGHNAIWASVWMHRIETPPAEIGDQLDRYLTGKIASRGGHNPLPDEAVIENYSIRPGAVEHILINGHQALRAIGEFRDAAGEPNTELLVWISTEHARAYFDLRARASQFETLQPVFEQLIQSAKIP